jgi:hypothetical protein
MKTYPRNATYLRTRLTAACLLPLLLLLAGCDRVTGFDDQDPGCPLGDEAAKAGCEPVPGGAPFTIIFTAEAGTAGLHFHATGALEDAGAVHGDLLRVDLMDLAGELPDAWAGLRGLQGAHGVLALSFEGERTASAHGPEWTGRFEVLADGTGAYAGLRGSGLFTVRLDEDGRPVETFTGAVQP